MGERPTRIDVHNLAVRMLPPLEADVGGVINDFAAHTDIVIPGDLEGPVRAAFIKGNCSLDQPAFARVMARRLPRAAQLGEVLLGADATADAEVAALFDAVDVTGHGVVTFAQLMDFVIDAALHGSIGSAHDSLPQYGTLGSRFLKNLSEVTAARYCPELGMALTAGRFVGLVNTADSETRAIPYPSRTGDLPRDLQWAAGGRRVIDSTTTVYAVDYIPHLEAVVMGGTDFSLAVVAVDTGALLFHVPLPEPCTELVFERSASAIVAASRSPGVRVIRVPHHRTGDGRCEPGPMISALPAPCTRMVPLGRDALVALAGQHPVVYICDIRSGATVTRFTGHETAVGLLHYIPGFAYMASCAFDTNLRVWAASGVASRSDSFALSDPEMPHVERVVGCCHVDGTPQLLTIDTRGLIKLWDLRTLMCQQSIRADRCFFGIVRTSTVKWHSILYDDAARAVCVFSERRVQVFRTLNTEKERRQAQVAATRFSALRVKPVRRGAAADADDIKSVAAQLRSADAAPIMCIALNTSTSTVLTCTEKRGAVWDVFTGRLDFKLDRLLDEHDKDSITAVSVTDNGRCFIMGTALGHLAVHVYSTGRLLSVLRKAGDLPPITALCPLIGTRSFVVTTADDSQIFYEEPAFSEGIHVFFPGEAAGALCVVFDCILFYVVAGYRTGSVCVHEVRRQRVEPHTVRSVCDIDSAATQDITALQCLTGFPALAIADGGGVLTLYTLPPHGAAGMRFGKTALRMRAVRHMCFYAARRVLYCADDMGSLISFDLTGALAAVGLGEPASTLDELHQRLPRAPKRLKYAEELVPLRAVQAHADLITGLRLVPGSPVLLSASLDRGAVAWDLGLSPHGEFDPVAPAGRYTVPFVSVAAPFSVALVAGDGVSAAPRYTPDEERHPPSATAARDAPPTESAQATQAMARRAPTLVSPELIALGVAATLRHDAVLVHSGAGDADVWKGLARDDLNVTPSRGESASRLVTSSPRSAGPALLEEGRQSTAPSDTWGTAADPLHSCNSTGVNHRAPLHFQPGRGAKVKTFIVETHESAAPVAPTVGGIPFIVTQDAPTDPSAKARRDRLLRKLKDAAEVTAEHEAQQARLLDIAPGGAPKSAPVPDAEQVQWGTPALPAIAPRLPVPTPARPRKPVRTPEPRPLPAALVARHSSRPLRSRTPAHSAPPLEPVPGRHRFRSATPPSDHRAQRGSPDPSTPAAVPLGFLTFGIRTLDVQGQWRNSHRV